MNTASIPGLKLLHCMDQLRFLRGFTCLRTFLCRLRNLRQKSTRGRGHSAACVSLLWKPGNAKNSAKTRGTYNYHSGNNASTKRLVTSGKR